VIAKNAELFTLRKTGRSRELPSWYRRGGAKRRGGRLQRIARIAFRLRFCERPPRPLLIKGCFAAFSLGRVHPSCSRRGVRVIETTPSDDARAAFTAINAKAYQRGKS
jgi:hypothetical protein